jgi:hypothetical protein
MDIGLDTSELGPIVIPIPYDTRDRGRYESSTIECGKWEEVEYSETDRDHRNDEYKAFESESYIDK